MKDYSGDVTITKKVYEEMSSEIHDARMVFRIMTNYIERGKDAEFLLKKYKELVAVFDAQRLKKHKELYPS